MSAAVHMLGFDAREGLPGVPPEHEWDDRRRQTFLLRPEVGRPLSVDRVVWPSIIGAGSIPRPPFTGFHGDDWESLAALRAHLDGATGHVPSSSIIAIELQLDLCTASEQAEWRAELTGIDPTGATRNPSPAHADPSAPEPSWTLLGFDVADRYGLSALSNCGSGPHDDAAVELRSQWRDLLDEHHLFRDRLDALAFKHLFDELVREHAPFFVYGLWLVETRRA